MQCDKWAHLLALCTEPFLSFNYLKTLQELIKLLKEAVDQMKKEVDCSACSVQSGCELFLRFITLAAKLEVRPCLYQTIVTIKFTGKVE